MLQLKKNSFLTILLLILLSTYAYCIGGFSHAHIVNGVMIVHSHPFDKDDCHTHTKGQVLTIDQLSHPVLLPEVAAFTFKTDEILIDEFFSDERLLFVPESRTHISFLRGPPQNA